jgi:hypothetical protein
MKGSMKMVMKKNIEEKMKEIENKPVNPKEIEVKTHKKGKSKRNKK